MKGGERFRYMITGGRSGDNVAPRGENGRDTWTPRRVATATPKSHRGPHATAAVSKLTRPDNLTIRAPSAKKIWVDRVSQDNC